jgi:hypothetical protein
MRVVCMVALCSILVVRYAFHCQPLLEEGPSKSHEQEHRDACHSLWRHKGRMNEYRCKPCHHFLYSCGAFARLYPENPTPTRNYAAKTKRWLRVCYKFALDIWVLMSVPLQSAEVPKEVNNVMARFAAVPLSLRRRRFG